MRVLCNILLALTGPLLAACAATAPGAPATAAAPADTIRRSLPAAIPAEDVRKYRPAAATTPPKATATLVVPLPKAAYVAPTNHVNAPLEQRLRDQAFTNTNVKYTQGFRILAYVGLERDKAMAIRRNVISRYPEETDYITFKQPVYRLYIGDYVSKLEAIRGMRRVRPLAPKAELEATQVLLNKLP
jgi:hypothetical protein